VRIRDWISEHNIKSLNVVGPSEQAFPGVGRAAERFMRELLAGGSTGVNAGA